MPVQKQPLTDYLAGRLGAPVVVRSLRQAFPGMSRETWLIEAEVSGERQGFALRVDPPEGPSCPQPLSNEFLVYSRLWKSPIPVAEPLWFDQGIDFAEGRPHMVRRLVEGRTSIAGLNDNSAEGASLRRRVAFECVEKLVMVHQLDWKAYGLDEFLPVPASPKDALRAEFRVWRDLWNERRPGPFPVIEEALCWLEDNIPTDTTKISLVKGNNGIGEEIWRDGRIVAMSDWELASLGDSVLDIAFSQGTFTLSSFSEALRYYEQCSGEQISPHRLAFCMFHIWFKQLCCVMLFMYRHYMEGRSPRIFHLSIGGVLAKSIEHRLVACIGKDLYEAYRMVSGHERNLYSAFAGSK